MFEVLPTVGRVSLQLLNRWNSLEVDVQQQVPDGPCLYVANHGFGTLTDLNVLAALGAITQVASARPVTPLVHQLAWTLKIGPILEAMGCRMASPGAGSQALREGRHVLVFPGGDFDGAKPHSDRNLVHFYGRSGFAKLARSEQVPVVPVVTFGAGGTLYVVSNGSALARSLRLPELIRCSVLPISISVPWGLSIGLVGFVPYLPLPTKLRTAILPAMQPAPGESDHGFAHRVEVAMQSAMDDMAHRDQ